VHLINYNNYEDTTQTVKDRDIKLTFKLTAAQVVKDVSGILPEGDTAFVENWCQKWQELSIDIKELPFYGIVSIKF
jgi:hypothetical protein